MSSGINRQVIEEGHVRAIKDTGTFGGGNMWHLEVKDANGEFENVAWLEVGNVQPFFKQKLPRYKETIIKKYEQL